MYVTKRDSKESRLQVLTTPEGFNLMVDNLGGVGITPDQHMFASVFVSAADKREFIAALAKAMDVPVQFYLTEEERTSGPFVSVTEPYPGDTQWTVSGDATDGLTQEQYPLLCAKVGQRSDMDESPNHMLQELVHKVWPKPVEMDSEYSCFFAYLDTEEDAKALADFINGRTWLA